MSTDQVMPFAAIPKEAARLSGMSQSTVYNLLREGKIERRKRGATTLVLLDGLQRYVEGLPKATFGTGSRVEVDEALE